MVTKIVDSHVHFWDDTQARLEWIKDTPVLNRAYHPPHLFEEAGAEIEIDRIVFVQADVIPEESLAEVRWISALAKHYPQIQGIVAFAPLEDPAATDSALQALSDYPLVKGVRRLIQSEPLGFARQPDFVRGVQSLDAYGYSFDICIHHPQLADTLYLVEQCPDGHFVLDHIGKPGIKDGIQDPWRAQIAALAEHPNVWCKLSGMVTEADHQGWTAEDLKPYVDHIIECFGVDRLMYGGDWPVVKLASSYRRWFETIQSLTAQWSPAEKQQVFYDNASRFYRL